MPQPAARVINCSLDYQSGLNIIVGTLTFPLNKPREDILNEHIRNLFPALDESVYLNCASVGPPPTIVLEAVKSQLRDVSLYGSTHYQDWVDTKSRARELIAKMLHVRTEQIAFMRNTSDGFATVANGLSWDQNDNIVTFAHEFPANYYPWRRIRDKYGAELRLCSEVEGRVDIDGLINLIDENTKIVAISAIQFSTGFRADLRRIGKRAREVDALFCVDIIQAFGASALDLPASLVDVASGAGHKWLFAPEGCGILYLSDRARMRVEPTLVGWISVDDPWDFSDYEQDYKPNALAWESGTGAASLFYGLEQSLILLSETGVEAIEAYLEDLTDFLCEIIPADKYQIASSRQPGDNSQIVCITNRAGLTSIEVSKQLEDEKIIVSARGPRLRISPHFFNNREDIEKLVENLP